MIFKKFLISSLLLLVIITCISSVSAISDNDEHNNNLTSYLLNSESSSDIESEDGYDKLSISDSESVLKESRTIDVGEINKSYTEMNDHTIRNAIQSANDGDTIIINGKNYNHVHIVIDKKLTIKSNVGTSLSHCSNQGAADSGYPGIFYITSEASGTVIEGFNFNNDNGILSNDDGYGILINGASDVIIRNCNISNNDVGDAIRLENSKNNIIQNVFISKSNNGVKIKNSNDITIKNSVIGNSNYGIFDVNSARTMINSNNITNNKIAGISVSGSSNDPTISFNNLTMNKNAINLTSSNTINILSNYLAMNYEHGVYINCKVEKINIIGNFFYKNKQEDVFNDVNTKGLWSNGGETLEVVNNNYMVGVGERPVQRADSVGGGVFLGYTFEINENVNCPILYFKYGNEKWYEGNYWLKLSDITQSKKGVYSISIVDADGNVAKGLSSVPVTFYLNKNNNYVSPQTGDVYKSVMMVDGTATVKFKSSDFKESSNVLIAVLPGASDYITGDQYKNIKTFNISDDSIPGNITETKIIISDLNTYTYSNVDFIITLTDIDNNPLANESIIFTINSVNYPATTNAYGQASIKINQNVGVYDVSVYYHGDDEYYMSAKNVAKITVSKLPTRLVSSNYMMFAEKNSYYKVVLKDTFGNAIVNHRITFKVNKKSYIVRTNSKGIAKIKLNLKKGTYKVLIKYAGNSKYQAVKKTNKILVKNVLKSRIIAPKVIITPKTSVKYIITLKGQNGVVIPKQKVTVKVNGKSYAKKTNNKGRVSVKVKFSKLKSYAVKVTYEGNKLYKKSTATGKITVQKTVTRIIASDIETYPNTENDYIISLQTNTGKALAKQSIKISLNGQTFTRTTDTNGQIIIKTCFADENTYPINIVYSGSKIYKSSNAANNVKVSRIATQLSGYNKTFSKDSRDTYNLFLSDLNGNPLANQPIIYSLNNQSYRQSTGSNGYLNVNVSSLGVGSYNLVANFIQTNQYKASSFNSLIVISNKTGVTFIDDNLANDEIQLRLDNAENNVEFLGSSYDDVSLYINKFLNLTFKNTTLNGKLNSPVLTIASDNIKLSNLTIKSNEGHGIIVRNSRNVTVENNIILNNLDQSKIKNYDSGNLALPGNGIGLFGVSDVNIDNNTLKSFNNAVFAQNSNDLNIHNNRLSLSNYGITYDVGVKNTEISYNLITGNVGLYVMDVPEGPLGYGIFLNQSGVNVTISNNNISNNYMGISIDSNHSTGIVITNNLICDNALEGIRFNAGYDLAETAVEPYVNDNAIYRNAKGPSMMILGELSANPNGIYQYGIDNDAKKLHLGANWYGKNARITWDYDNNVTGYGTMCPRINTTYISVGEIEVLKPNNYSITFYKNGSVANKLPEFEMYATLNNEEIKINIINGVGNFSFNPKSFNTDSNDIKISCGSLKDEYRTFEVLLHRTLKNDEIPT